MTFDCITEISFYLLKPIVMKLMLDAAIQSDLAMLQKGILITLAICVMGMLLFVPLEFYLFKIFQTTSAHIRNCVFDHILHLPVPYIERNHSGDTISRLSNDVPVMERAFQWSFRMILVTLLSGMSAATMMLFLDWKVSIILILIGLLSVVINVKQANGLRKVNDRIQKKMGEYTENLSNVINGFMTIKSLQLDKSMLENTKKINGEILKDTIAISTKSAFSETRNFFFSSINFIGVILLASYLAIKGISSLGSVVSMVFLLNTVNNMFGNINSMLINLQGYLAASSRVSGLMETEKEVERVDIDAVNKNSTDFKIENEIKTEINPKIKTMIELQDIEFSYEAANKVLSKISLSIKKGEVAALVGPSGGGKSTIMKLLLGYYQPQSGKMSIQGRAIKEFTLEKLRALIAYVPQDAYIFDTSIAENIRYGKANASLEEIKRAAKAAYADEFIMELSDGYDTLVGERGVKLSGGQRQRISIARAFLKDAPILLLDEATSSLDSQSELYIQEALQTLMQGKTSLVIAHRLSTIEHADVIFIVDEGRIVEFGKHEDLLAKGDLYRTLHRLQFEDV
jgi:ABC-type multidrug transport system fused ATPase/permease subunit